MGAIIFRFQPIVFEGVNPYTMLQLTGNKSTNIQAQVQFEASETPPDLDETKNETWNACPP